MRKRLLRGKSVDQIRLMRSAGLVVAEALRETVAAVGPGVTPRELDKIAESVIRRRGATPSFLGYQGFPASICVSVNEQVVHGIPGDVRLRDGDLVSIDCGAVLAGWHGDAAVTVGVGDVSQAARDLSEATRRALWAGIRAATVGASLGDVGHAIEASLPAGYAVVDGYVGHGIGRVMHETPPDVPNVGRPGEGPRLPDGLTIAIEPMVTVGTEATLVLADGWTVVSEDGALAAHWEHTMAVTATGPWVLTAEDGGRAELGAAVSELAD